MQLFLFFFISLLGIDGLSIRGSGSFPNYGSPVDKLFKSVLLYAHYPYAIIIVLSPCL